MTTDPMTLEDGTGATARSGDEGFLLPDDLLQSLDREAQHRARAARGLLRGRARRRLLTPALVFASVLGMAGVADRLVQASTPGASSSAPPAGTAALAPAATGAGQLSAGQLRASVQADARALAGVARALAADQQAIAALARSQAQIVASAARGDGGEGSAPAVNVRLPALPAVPSVQVPNVAVPNVVVPAAPAPVVHATTGASVVVP